MFHTENKPKGRKKNPLILHGIDWIFSFSSCWAQFSMLVLLELWLQNFLARVSHQLLLQRIWIQGTSPSPSLPPLSLSLPLSLSFSHTGVCVLVVWLRKPKESGGKETVRETTKIFQKILLVSPAALYSNILQMVHWHVFSSHTDYSQRISSVSSCL